MYEFGFFFWSCWIVFSLHQQVVEMFVSYPKIHIIPRGTLGSGMLPRYLIWLAVCLFST